MHARRAPRGNAHRRKKVVQRGPHSHGSLSGAGRARSRRGSGARSGSRRDRTCRRCTRSGRRTRARRGSNTGDGRVGAALAVVADVRSCRVGVGCSSWAGRARTSRSGTSPGCRSCRTRVPVRLTVGWQRWFAMHVPLLVHGLLSMSAHSEESLAAEERILRDLTGAAMRLVAAGRRPAADPGRWSPRRRAGSPRSACGPQPLRGNARVGGDASASLQTMAASSTIWSTSHASGRARVGVVAIAHVVAAAHDCLGVTHAGGGDAAVGRADVGVVADDRRGRRLADAAAADADAVAEVAVVAAGAVPDRRVRTASGGARVGRAWIPVVALADILAADRLAESRSQGCRWASAACSSRACRPGTRRRCRARCRCRGLPSSQPGTPGWLFNGVWKQPVISSQPSAVHGLPSDPHDGTVPMVVTRLPF